MLFIVIFTEKKSKDVKTIYDSINEEISAKIQKDATPFLEHYIKPSKCPLGGTNIPTVKELEIIKINNPSLYKTYLDNGILRRSIFLHSLQKWVKKGDCKTLMNYGEFCHNHINNIQHDINHNNLNVVLNSKLLSTKTVV